MLWKSIVLAVLLGASLVAPGYAQSDKNSDKVSVDKQVEAPPVDAPDVEEEDEEPPVAPADDEDPAAQEEADLDTLLDAADGARNNAEFDVAFELYSLAAESGNYYAMNELALLYDMGRGTSEDDETAFDWFMKAARGGNRVAMTNAGNMYEYGDGVGQSYDDALFWYRESADLGHPLAMYYIGNFYAEGIAVTKDAEEAAAWYQKAIDEGQPDAHWSMAVAYLYGRGVGKDTTKAADLAYFALTHGVQKSLDEFQRIKTADTSINFRKRIQTLLEQDNYYEGAIDGSFGPRTQEAIDEAFASAL